MIARVFFKRHLYFLGLSGLTVVVMFSVGLYAANQASNGEYQRLITNPNNVYLVCLRLVIYCLIFYCWHQQAAKARDVPPMIIKNVRMKLVPTDRYKLLLYFALVEVLLVQQWWVIALQTLWM